MDNMVKKYLSENTELLHRELLDSLGIFDYEKEYAPDNYERSMAIRFGYTQSETVDGVIRYYYIKDRIYPKITEEEYEALLRISKEKERIDEKKDALWKKNNPEKKEPTQYSITATSPSAESFASKFLRFLALFLWIGGLIASIIVSRVEVSVGSYRTETEFQWATFITFVSIYIGSGCLCWCMADVVADIRMIASSIQHFRAKEDT